MRRAAASWILYVGILLSAGCGGAAVPAREVVETPVVARAPEAPSTSATTPRPESEVTAPAAREEVPVPTEPVVVEPPPLPLTPAQEKAAQLFATASSDYKQWSAAAGDTGTNRDKRIAATQSLTTYYQANRTNAAAAKQVVEAAYALGTMKKAAGDATWRTWFRSTVSAWDDYRAKAPLRGTKSDAQFAPYVDYAAEADFRLLDEQITTNHDNAARHTYPTTLVDILGAPEINPVTKKVVIGPDGRPKMTKIGKYQTNAAETEKWDRELEKLTRKYESREWMVAVIERQAGLFDTLRSGLASLTNVAVLTPDEVALLQKMRASGRPDVIALAKELESAKQDFWKAKRQLELDGCDTVMVRRYATALAFARAHKVRSSRAQARLGFYTDVIGDARMKEIVTSTPDPAARGGAMLTYKDRQYTLAP